MKVFVFSALGLLLLIFLMAWLITRVRYVITPRHVRVLLFGVAIRRIPIRTIESVSKRRSPGLAENWWSTLSPKHRSLVLRRKTGLIRNVVLTPRNRYAFKFELDRIISEQGSPAEARTNAESVFED